MSANPIKLILMTSIPKLQPAWQLASRSFSRSCVCHRFHEYDPKAEYRDEKWREEMKKKNWERQKATYFGFKDGFKNVREEVKKWQSEVYNKLTNDSMCAVMHGDVEKVFQFNTKEAIANWLIVSDSDHNEGYSKCKFELSPTGHGLFHGFVNTNPPKDGKIKKAGYCSIKCPRKTKSFYRDDYYEWGVYSHFVMRVRGDGRSYMINLSTAGYFDIEWNDVYQYILFTRGGPYWQDVRIPFSKFVFSHKGRLQDKQRPISKDMVASVGISAGKVDGPFALEIDYIGVECDWNHTEKFAYELYQLPEGVANV